MVISNRFQKQFFFIRVQPVTIAQEKPENNVCNTLITSQKILMQQMVLSKSEMSWTISLKMIELYKVKFQNLF
jgi:hypothetical protein